MNSNVLLISEDALKTYSNLNKNTFGDWILPAIREAQEMGLMPIIGECLYNKICELVADGSINDVLFTAYKDLLDDKIQPYLIYKTLSNIIPILNAKMANLGVVVTNDEHVVNLTQSESDLLKSYYSERCDFYTKRLQDFIKSNQSAFPEISCGCGKMQPNLESSENSVGVWLGGSRGKKIGNNNNCICSSTEVTHADYQSGFTDGVEFQKRKLEITAVTENGRYIREDGYSEVVVDVQQTGHTDEEMRQQYENGIADGINIQKEKLSAITLTQNGEYSREDGYSTVTVNVAQTGHTDEEMTEQYQSGYTSGETHQKALLSAITISQNGSYERENGYSAVTVDVQQTGHTDEEMRQQYENGKTVGVSEQKSKLSTITINQNGDYNREDGYSAITVNVAGQKPSLQSKSIIENGQYMPDEGYDGFSSVEVAVPTGHTDEELTQAYNNGYTSGYTSGETHQKTLLSTVTLTKNGSYERADGYSAVTVNVAQTGHTDEEMTEQYQSGYTNGEAYQKSLMTSTAITQNGVYTRGNGFSAITVNVEQTGVSGNEITVAENVYLNEYGTYYFTYDSATSIDSMVVHFLPTAQTDYLTFKAIEDCELFFVQASGVPTTKLDYKVNNGNWITLTGQKIHTGVTIANLNAGDELRLRGINSTIKSGNESRAYTSFYGTGKYKISGNILSILYGDDYSNRSTINESYCFSNLFGSDMLVSARDLMLPSNVTYACYSGMFSGSHNLVEPPVLPATTLDRFCYQSMFSNCTSLTTAPALPATTLRDYCYDGMFQGCTSLTTAPELPATTLSPSCYREMFYDCTSLNYIKCLATDISSSYCTDTWVSGVASTGTFVKNSNMTSWAEGNSGIPTGWTIVDNS